MNNDLFLEDVLSIYRDITVFLKPLEKKVFRAYFGNKLIVENVGYDVFSKKIAEVKKYDLESTGKIFRFITNLNVNVGFFEQNANFKTIDGELIPTIAKGKKIDEDNILLIFTDFIDKKDEFIDPVSKVLNHSAMIAEIKSEIEKKNKFVLMLVDIDNFKEFNESYGTMYGDTLLLETAASIKKYIKNSGYIGRIYGDQFAVVIHIDDNYDVIHDACTNVRAAISNLSNHNVKQAKITATIGCASFPKDASSFNELSLKCQKALLRGKRKGKNCFIIYTEKCLSIRDDEIVLPNINDSKAFKPASSSMIAGMYEILSREGDQIRNVYDTLSLIGNYFMLDRVVLIARAPDKERLSRPSNVYEWINPARPELRGLIESHADRGFYWEEVWQRSFDNIGMIKFSQVESNKDNIELYTQLKEQQTTAMLALQLTTKDRICGVIRFDMCSTNRFWTQKDVSDLIVISKIFAVDMQKYQEQKSIEQALYYDSLTNLYNYSKWRVEVFNILNSQTSYKKYSLVYLSVSGFNTLNNLYGMSYGNILLKTIADALLKLNTEDSTFCRITEDKFLIFYEHSNLDLIKTKFKQLTDYVTKEVNLKNSFKIHAGIYIHNEIDNLATSIDKANLARKYKIIPEDGLVVFNDEMYIEEQKKNEIELHMYDALKNNEFKLFLQPKVNLSTGEIIGAEALSRWHYKNERFLTPDKFIPIFEKNGFINTLDFEVFKNVCIFQRKCIDNNIVPKKISVNVSRYQQDFNKYIETIDSIRKEYNLDASLFDIEITEGMYIENTDQIADFIKSLHEAGYSVSMDDFGAGYSNLSNLACLNFDLVKLDKNFCNDKENEKENIILSFVMSLVKNLKMDVLCEGVETKEFALYLKKLGCNLVQGFLFDKPIPADDFFNKYVLTNKKFEV